MSASSEDEDIKKAIALSLAHASESPKTATPKAKPSSMSGLDRAAIERERLARLKRKASVSPPPVAAKRAALSTAVDDDVLIPDTKSSATPPPGFAFPNGKVLKTWAFGHTRKDDIKLEEVLQKQDLKLAVFGSFIWDTEWLLQKLDMSSTRVVCVMQAKDEMTKAQMRTNTEELKNLRLCFPSMEGLINCMHSKLMLLAHPGYLRVVVPSGNLIPHDWGETGAMENVVFVIDLPRLSDGTATPKMPKFGHELIRFCKALGLEDALVESLSQFDFSATEDLAFVHTIGGGHIEEEVRGSTGYMGLGRAVKDLGLVTKQNVDVDFVTSSLGNINEAFLFTLYHAAQGDPPLAPSLKASKKSNVSNLLNPKDQSCKAESSSSSLFGTSRFTIYFPTHATVAASAAGTHGAGTICLSSKYFNSDSFPRASLRDCKSTRPGMVIHSKIMYVRHSKDESDKDFAYVGSANLSESAWGKVVMDKKLKREKLNCRNWESGVIIPVRRRVSGEMAPVQENALNDTGGRDLVGVFKGVVPVPMQWPGEEYGKRKPWFAFG